MVRLVDTLVSSNGIIFKFQFHYGTIGSDPCQLLYLQPQQFQFHYGTIGSTKLKSDS